MTDKKTQKQLEAEIRRLEVVTAQQTKKLEDQKKNLDGALAQLKATVILIENWANGPVFKRAGVIWPNNTCNAPAYVGARRFLKLYYEAND